MILLLQGQRLDEYLRFLQDGEKWRFAGFLGVDMENHPRRHEIVHIGDKLFLTVSMQGISGTDADSESQVWCDLSQPELDPIFTFTVQGEECSGVVRRRVRTDAQASRAGDVDVITLTTTVDFYLAEARLSSLQYIAPYQRKPGERYFFLATAESGGDQVSAVDYDLISNIKGGLPFEQVLVYAIPGLAKLASGTDLPAKAELRAYLELCKNTPEKKALLDLLGKP